MILNRCALCQKPVKTVTQICNYCADVIEFGYPSFPAYRLEEKRPREVFVYR